MNFYFKNRVFFQIKSFFNNATRGSCSQVSQANLKYRPIRVDLEVGKKYAWCTCGKSVKQPFCDGSHRGTEFRPFIFEGCGSQVLCVCKKTNIKPFCDNTHEKLMDKLIN